MSKTTVDDYRYYIKMKIEQGKINKDEFIAYFGETEIQKLELV